MIHLHPPNNDDSLSIASGCWRFHKRGSGEMAPGKKRDWSMRELSWFTTVSRSFVLLPCCLFHMFFSHLQTEAVLISHETGPLLTF